MKQQTEREQLNRLTVKTLDQVFVVLATDGLGWPQFDATTRPRKHKHPPCLATAGGLWDHALSTSTTFLLPGSTSQARSGCRAPSLLHTHIILHLPKNVKPQIHIFAQPARKFLRLVRVFREISRLSWSKRPFPHHSLPPRSIPLTFHVSRITFHVSLPSPRPPAQVNRPLGPLPPPTRQHHGGRPPRRLAAGLVERQRPLHRLPAQPLVTDIVRPGETVLAQGTR